jgi:alpha-galactosidase
LRLSDAERNDLAAVIALHKRFRPLLHAGDVVRFDTPDPALNAHGVYAADRSEALVCAAQLRTAMSLTPAPLRLPGLTADARYHVERVALPDDRAEQGRSRTAPPWLSTGITLSGRDLAVIGLQLSVLNPESAVLLHLRRL